MARQGSPVALDRDGRGSPGMILPANSSIQSWLDILGLSEYKGLFKQYKMIEDILNWSEIDIRDLGVRNGGHRARMISNLVMIRESNTRRIRPRAQDTGTVEKSAFQASTNLGSSYGTVPLLRGNRHPFADPFGQSLNLGTVNVENLAINPWYHGGISRQEAEQLVSGDGRFLVRDSFTQRGDFVLTTYWKGAPLHFVVNKITVAGQTKVMYHFEEEPFDSVTNLIQYYLHSGKPVTTSSGAVLSIPIVRSGFFPPTGATIRSEMLLTCGENETMKPKRTGSVPLLNFDGDEPDEQETLVMVSVEKRHGSLPSIGKNALSLIEISEKSSESTPMSTDRTVRGGFGSMPQSPESGATTIAGKERAKENGPPKPSRVPTVKRRLMERPLIIKRNQALYDDDGKDYSDYDQIKLSPHRKANYERTIGDFETAISNSRNLVGNSLNSYFDNLASYENSLLSAENKPLDASSFATIKALILQGDAVLLARHLTAIDLDLVKVTGSLDFGFGVTSGLELMTLPQGHYLREDIIERHFSLKLFVSVTIVHCTNTTERLETVNRWVQVAHELLNCFGNLFGFSAVMEGLLAEQVQRLAKSWMAFDQSHCTSSSLFSNQLRNFLKGLNDATSILPLQNVTVPHILPLAELLEDTGATLMTPSGKLKFDLESLLAHLDSARIFAEQCDSYRKSAENLLAESNLQKSLIDLLSPRTHLKFLWGSKGIRASQSERFWKFEKILTALSEKVEPHGR